MHVTHGNLPRLYFPHARHGVATVMLNAARYSSLARALEPGRMVYAQPNSAALLG